jgi:hypothetical protein
VALLVIVVGLLVLPVVLAAAFLVCGAVSLLSDVWRCHHQRGDVSDPFLPFDAISIAEEAERWLKTQ